MNEAKYPSKERIERDGVLIHAEGDDLLNDPDEAKRQGYKIDPGSAPQIAKERIERDGVLVAAEGDVIPDAPSEPDVQSVPTAKPKSPARKRK